MAPSAPDAAAPHPSASFLAKGQTLKDGSLSGVHSFRRQPNRSVQYSIFNGATLLQWLKVLVTYFSSVEWGKYWSRVLFVSLVSVCISILASFEALFCWVALRRQQVNKRPVFILGHPRSGTTLLHNMIALDVDRFAYCNTLACLFPSAFFALERLRCMFETALPPTRPMDNVPLGFDLPQEDEVAAALLTGGYSPFLLFFFGKKEHRERLLRCLDFCRGAGGPQPAEVTAPSPGLRAAGLARASSPAGGLAAEAGAGERKSDNSDLDQIEAGFKMMSVASGDPATDLAVTAIAAASSDEGEVAPVATVRLKPAAAKGAAPPAVVPGETAKPAVPAACMPEKTAVAAAAAAECPVNECYSRWESWWMHFLRKVSYSVGTERRLLLKSPAHTARVRVLLRLFPDAQFIFIHRDPYEVFQSMARMVGSISGLSCLYDATDEEFTDAIFEQYRVMYDAYERDCHLVPQGSLIELRYSALDADPVASLEAVYRQLGWGEPPTATWRAYVAAHHGSRYAKNNHLSLSPGVRQRIATDWAACFERFGYEIELPERRRHSEGD